MRMHTAMHLLSAILPYPVTGGSVGEAESRLDFDIPEAGLDKDEITAKLADMIATDAEVRYRWISDEELAANPGLVKTMSVKPPMGTGRVRLVEIVGLDLQPCGGTHVRRTSEIGAVRVTRNREEGQAEPPRAAGLRVKSLTAPKIAQSSDIWLQAIARIRPLRVPLYHHYPYLRSLQPTQNHRSTVTAMGWRGPSLSTKINLTAALPILLAFAVSGAAYHGIERVADDAQQAVSSGAVLQAASDCWW